MCSEIRRHELKYYVNRMEAATIRARLSSIMGQASNAGPFGTYTISSLCFDDYADSALADNLAGVDF